MNQLMQFDNELFNLKAQVTEDNEILFDAESVAKCLGISKTAASGNIVVRWDRINSYLESFPQVATIKKGDFVPEAAVYLLAMKAKNDTAVKFQLWLATEVLPAIRTQGAYITENASAEEIDLAAKFGPRRIKNTFLTCSIEEIEAAFSELKEYYKKQSTENRLKAYSKVRNSLSERYDKYMNNNNLGFAHEIKIFLDETLRPIETKTKNRSNGAIKANQTKKINELQEQINSIMPKEDEYITVNIHPFSNNSMYKPVINNKTKKPMLVKTEVYKH